MKAYSPDLCAKVARAYDEGEGSQRQLSRQFRVSLAFIQKMRRRQRATGEPAAIRRLKFIDESGVNIATDAPLRASAEG